jgi:hypothetical protein
MANGVLGQLQQLAGRLTVSQVILAFLAVGLALLVIDYTRVLLLRRKMASISSLKKDIH